MTAEVFCTPIQGRNYRSQGGEQDQCASNSGKTFPAPPTALLGPAFVSPTRPRLTKARSSLARFALHLPRSVNHSGPTLEYKYPY